jgi:DnaJ-class molecular chaperone
MSEHDTKSSGVEEPDYDPEAPLYDDDTICKTCDGTGTHHRQLCKTCSGTGYTS